MFSADIKPFGIMASRSKRPLQPPTCQFGAANATNLRTAIRSHGWHLPFSLKSLGYFTQGWQTWLRIQPCLDQDGFKEALDLLDNPERFAIHGVPSGQDLKCYSSDSASAMKRAPVFRSQRHADAFFKS